ARSQRARRAGNALFSVKRLLGRSLKDLGDEVAQIPYKLVDDDVGAQVRIQVGAKAVSPVEISAEILRALKTRAEAVLGESVQRAVVTVPAYFDDAQRQATRDAARLAGLEAVRIVNEPTAAALAYGLGLRHTEPRTIVIFDLGGGTFDVSVLRLTPAENAQGADAFQVLATAGDTHLGGDDFDHALIDLFTREMTQRFGAMELPPAARKALANFAEQAKIRLSAQESAAVRIDLGEGRVYERSITRDEFEGLIGELVDRAIALCRRTLRDARRAIGEDAVSAVVLVGGSTRVPLVRRRVAEFFGIEPYTALDPDQVVALGAAVQASILAGSTRDAMLLDVIPLSLGIETVGGAVAKLIVRNSTVPTAATEMFSTSVDGQTSIKLHVLQGEREMAADCRSLGAFHLSGIPAMPAGIPQLEVRFGVDANGVLSVSAVERRSGKRAAIQIVPNHGLSREEVERIERDSFAHAREDMTRHRIVDLVSNSKLDLHWIGRQMQSHADKLEPAARAAIEAAIEKLRAMVAAAESDWESVDADEFHKSKEGLDRASVRLHEVSIAESLKGSRTDPAS
ncbi:MAG: Hsp70 family protein, partial [Phycisphaerales bacterium]